MFVCRATLKGAEPQAKTSTLACFVVLPMGAADFDESCLLLKWGRHVGRRGRHHNSPLVGTSDVCITPHHVHIL